MDVLFRLVDAFTETPFQGNRLCVVPETPDAFSTEQMKMLALETNFSETTFVTESRPDGYRMRIFTPDAELPFAGHPTIGSAHAALESGFVSRKAKLVQECGAGLIELDVESDGRIFLKGPPPKLAKMESQIPSIPLLPASKVIKVDVGPIWVVGEMSDARALAALKPDMTALAEWSVSLGVTGTTVFAPSGESSSAIHVRSFAPAHAIPEDPVCGTGNLSVAAVVEKRFGVEYIARQGMQMGRNGQVFVRRRQDSVYLGGHAVTCVDGTLAC
jgi:PhzF family phenazine biosynthesis protein